MAFPIYHSIISINRPTTSGKPLSQTLPPLCPYTPSPQGPPVKIVDPPHYNTDTSTVVITLKLSSPIIVIIRYHGVGLCLNQGHHHYD